MLSNDVVILLHILKTEANRHKFRLTLKLFEVFISTFLSGIFALHLRMMISTQLTIAWTILNFMKTFVTKCMKTYFGTLLIHVQFWITSERNH